MLEPMPFLVTDAVPWCKMATLIPCLTNSSFQTAANSSFVAPSQLLALSTCTVGAWYNGKHPFCAAMGGLLSPGTLLRAGLLSDLSRGSPDLAQSRHINMH